MTEPAFTAGPWEYDGKFTVGIPHVKGTTYFRTNPEDAKAIHAFPEVFSALQEVMEWINSWDNEFDEEDEWQETKARVEAAIMKAIG